MRRGRVRKDVDDDDDDTDGDTDGDTDAEGDVFRASRCVRARVSGVSRHGRATATAIGGGGGVIHRHACAPRGR